MFPSFVKMLIITLLISCRSLNSDLVAISIPLVYTNELGHNVTTSFQITYSQLKNVQQLVDSFLEQNPVDPESLYRIIRSEVDKYKYTEVALSGGQQLSDTLSSQEAVASMLENINTESVDLTSLSDRALLIGDVTGLAMASANHFIDIRGLLAEARNTTPTAASRLSARGQGARATLIPWRTASVVPAFIRDQQRILMYQNRGAHTGGTIAMFTLFQRLETLGYNVHMCNDTNAGTTECTQPSDLSVVITGEWCRGALQDYSEEAALFPGRGVQYHLGFHHRSDVCRGRVTVTDSQYLWASFSDRIRGAYYWGCEMAAPVKGSLLGLLRDIADSRWPAQSQPYLQRRGFAAPDTRVMKEDLVVYDPDYMRDYPPHDGGQGMSIPLPRNTQLVVAQGVPADRMPLLLQRAKVVLDLAFPGPERLAGEGVLMGAIPVISNRWNGVSPVDFPGLLRVDPRNASDIAQVVAFAIENYEAIMSSGDTGTGTDSQSTKSSGGDARVEAARKGVSSFFAYILSMWRRAHHTADVVVGSAHLHFVFTASSLHEEHLSCFQILALLFVFPLASIDLYVQDPLWFIRHHYAFFARMLEAGYVVADPFDPADSAPHDRPTGGRGFLSLKSLPDLRSKLVLAHAFAEKNNSSLQEYQLVPPWNPVAVLLRRGWVFPDAFALLDALAPLTADGLVEGPRSHTQSGEAREVGDEGGHWVAVSPFSRLSASLVHLELLLEGAGSTGTVHRRHAQMVRVCELLYRESAVCEAEERPTSSSPAQQPQTQTQRETQRQSLVHLVVNSVPWRTEQFFLEQTVGNASCGF